MGLKLRLILVVVIPPMLVVGVYGRIRIRSGRAELLAETERTVRAIQASVERGLRDARASDVDGMLAEIVKDQQQIDRIRIHDRNAQPLLVSDRVPVATDVPAEVLRRVTDTGQPEVVSSGQREKRIFSYVPIRDAYGDVIDTMEVAQRSRIESVPQRGISLSG